MMKKREAVDGAQQSDDLVEDAARSAEERARARHSRRIRNQVISYIIVGVCLLAAGTGLYAAGRGFARLVARRQAQSELAKEAEAAEAGAFEGDLQPDRGGQAVGTPVSMEEDDETESQLFEEMIDRLIADMPLSDKVAGLFVVTPEQLTGVDAAVMAGDGTKEALSRFAVGGLVYGSKNIKDKDQIVEMLQKTGAMSKYPLFFAVSEPGGDGSELAKVLGLDSVPSPSELAESGDLKAAREAGEEIAKRLTSTGFSLNLSPRVNLTSDNMSESERTLSFGDDPSLASEIMSEEIRGQEENGVHTVAMVFPTIPDGKESEVSLEDLEGGEFKMFRAAIDAGCKVIEVGTFKALGVAMDDTPCALSSVIIEEILRDKIGFDGVVMTGALDEEAITEYYGAGEAAVEAIKAGADIVYSPADMEEAITAVEEAVNEGSLTEGRIDESLRRIYRIKYADKMVG